MYGQIYIENNFIDGLSGTTGTVYGILYAAAENAEIVCICGNRIIERNGATTGSIRGIQAAANATKTIDKLVIDRNVVDIANPSGSTFLINIPVVAGITNLQMLDNELTRQAADSSQVRFDSIEGSVNRPTTYNVRNNGTVPNESNLDANFVGRIAYRYRYTDDPNGTVVIGCLPPNAVVTKTDVLVKVQPTSAGTPTISLGIFTDDTNGLLAPTAIGSLTTGWRAGIQDGAPANFSNTTTATRQVVLTISAGDLTAGDLIVYLDYIIVR
jgi:hypothetical protein